jgi:hypothetical protein
MSCEFILKEIAWGIIATALIVIPYNAAFAGPCQYDSDRASDGSRCGGRSAESRPGG